MDEKILEKNLIENYAQRLNKEPFGLFLYAEYELVYSNKKVYPKAAYWANKDQYEYRILDKPASEMTSDDEYTELYSTITAAKKSEYFPIFLELRKEIDNTIVEAMNLINNIENYEVCLCQKFIDGELKIVSSIKNREFTDIEAHLELTKTPEGSISLSHGGVLNIDNKLEN